MVTYAVVLLPQTHKPYHEKKHGGRRGNTGVGDSEVQTIMYKISYKEIFYNTEYSQYVIIDINGA